MFGGAGVPRPRPLQWPDGDRVGGSGKKVVAYLKSAPSLAAVLDELDRAGHRTIAYVADVDPEVRDRFRTSGAVRLEDRPLDLSAAMADSDLAVLNGGHGTTAQALLAGKPTLQLPIYLEQRLTAEAVERLGAGAQASADGGDSIQPALRRLLTDDRYAAAARRFADRYAAFDPARQRRAMLERAEQLLAG